MNKKRKQPGPHRGRTKDGKRALHLHLSEAEYAELCDRAERECRSAVAQATWYVVNGLRGAND